MVAKDKHRLTIIEYIGNPSNDFPNRETIATEVLGFSLRQQLYNTFTVDELSEMEAEGLELRRKKYAPELSKVDTAMLKAAGEGDSKAAKLCYQRFEGWSEKKGLEISAPGGGPLKWETTYVKADVDKGNGEE